ncbi:XAP5 domain-containing protein [Cryptosporidium muris RN66]|uniref:XAP5 domain-containing protein n=1 Tax=Cryptosporidium muris (strain RN66) TaxID=441375 RepID=B6AI58_CRYMR|nr:XAP5 domain-containing protein [Cryptosporidium muris RN66]EEA07899.1 XAP5 domain-containing protein [Cryptosporidium muris RN66]|eukprot:XP_002142248.1 XAP5 domain-containing protein [Cryptosporidium muris RN66]
MIPQKDDIKLFKDLDEMFDTNSDTQDIEDKFKHTSIGLAPAEAFKKSELLGLLKHNIEDKTKYPKLKKPKIYTLSFEHEITNEDNKMKNQADYDVSFELLGKDKTVETQFLPDPKREAEEARKREEAEKEALKEDEELKKQIIEIVFSYWDGQGHRRSVCIPRGSTIGEFLETCRLKLKSEFRELSRILSSSLMYIKEDVILPHYITFHELIKTRARGKTGPLFHFNVFDDVRIISDIRRETTESHAGKVVQRQWYEKNKNTFPVYRWESYLPGKFNKPY